MAFPRRVSEALQEAGIKGPDKGRFTSDAQCEGAKFHSPTPLVVREVSLIPGQVRGKITAFLCGTCTDNLKVLQSLLMKYDGELAWPIRREFGNQIRTLAYAGWDEYQGRRKKS